MWIECCGRKVGMCGLSAMKGRFGVTKRRLSVIEGGVWK